MFPETKHLLKGKSRVSIADSLNGKDVVGLYFSAQWCHKFITFTPKLEDIYKEMIKKRKSFEIVFVFVTSDVIYESEDVFKKMFKKMPWLAIPFTEIDLRSKLHTKYPSLCLPHLVLLDGKSGETITFGGDARNAV